MFGGSNISSIPRCSMYSIVYLPGNLPPKLPKCRYIDTPYIWSFGIPVFGCQGSDSTIAGESLEAQCLCEVGVTRRISTRSCLGLGKRIARTLRGLGIFLGGFEQISQVFLKNITMRMLGTKTKRTKSYGFCWGDGQKDADYGFRCRLVFRFRSSSLEFPSDAKLEGMNLKYSWDIFKHTRKWPLKKNTYDIEKNISTTR